MADLEFDSPEQAGFAPDRWQHACDLLTQWCERGLIPSAGLIAGRGNSLVKPQFFGHQKLDGSQPIRNDAVFLIASITKPIVCAAFLKLLERGELTLSDRVIDYVPEFGKNGKSGVTIRNLLTHTSGLPDMLPNNMELRQAHAPLSEFVAGTCQEALAFAPGRGVMYQSMGILMLSEIIQRVTGVSCPAFVRKELFEPLEMQDSWLGAPAWWFEGATPPAERITEVRVPEDHLGQDWNWNSRYWRMLGAPWGGLLTTPTDLARYCQMMLGKGRLNDQLILSPTMVAASTRNQLEYMPDVPETDRRCKPWGLGWRLNWPAHSANFGDVLGHLTYGHWGATGTVLWIDPDQDAFFILLTTQPQEPNGSYLARISNVIATSILKTPRRMGFHTSRGND